MNISEVRLQLILDRLKIQNKNQPTLHEMFNFLELWECVCGICIICNAWHELNLKLMEEE